MNRLQLELADGTYVGLTYLTTGEYLSAWAELAGGDGSIRQTTAKNYDVAVRVHIVPVLGAVPVQQLTRKMIQGLYQVLRATGRARGLPGGLSPKSVYNVHLNLHRALEDAVADGSCVTTRQHAHIGAPHQPRGCECGHQQNCGRF